MTSDELAHQANTQSLRALDKVNEHIIECRDSNTKLSDTIRRLHERIEELRKDTVTEAAAVQAQLAKHYEQRQEQFLAAHAENRRLLVSILAAVIGAIVAAALGFVISHLR